MKRTNVLPLMGQTCLILLMAASGPPPRSWLWYRQPAAKGMNEALPIGGGRFGGLIYAGPGAGADRVERNQPLDPRRNLFRQLQ